MYIVMVLSLGLVGADFPICDDNTAQYYPCALYENDQYYVFWSDWRSYPPLYAIYAARVSNEGTVLDPGGKCLYNWQSKFEPVAASDGSSFLVAFRDSC